MSKNDLAQFGTKKKGCGTYILYFIAAIVAFSVIGNLISDDDGAKSESASQEREFATIGQPLITDMFEITANSFVVKDRVNTDNPYTGLNPEPGIRYLIINATYKNIDTESRMISDGSLWINYNGKNYEFDKSELLMSEGYGLFLDQLNPLTAKTTNLVYKIPSELSGDIYWQPGRVDGDDAKILLGTI